MLAISKKSPHYPLDTKACAPIKYEVSVLGGFVAVHAAATDTTGRVDRLVLMAPALDFGGNRLQRIGEQGIQDWRAGGRLRVFHYGENDWRDIGFALYEDAAQYDAYAVPVDRPTVVIQGRRDALVDLEEMDPPPRQVHRRERQFVRRILPEMMDPVPFTDDICGATAAGDEHGGVPGTLRQDLFDHVR